MRIWRVHELGEPTAVMRLEDAPLPEPAPGRVAIDMLAVGLKFPDLLQIRGGYQVKARLPFTPGGECVGRIVSVGDGVEPNRVGERVVFSALGGLAERVVVRATTAMFALPDDGPRPMPDEKAAALLTNYGTTWFALVDRANLQQGDVLLVHAGAGGVGSAAIQIGKALGAVVIATAGGPQKKQVCEELGADIAVDYLTDDFVSVVNEATAGVGADVIYDPVGGDTFDRSRKCIAWDGRILVIGFTSGRIADVPTNHILLKNYSVVGVHYGAWLGRDASSAGRVFVELQRLWEAGSIDPLIGEVLPMADAAHALERLGARASVGKLVVRPQQ